MASLYDHRHPPGSTRRPRTRNAQNRDLLVELDNAFLRAEADVQIRVVILAGAGPLFSSGHDMDSSESVEKRAKASPVRGDACT